MYTYTYIFSNSILLHVVIVKKNITTTFYLNTVNVINIDRAFCTNQINKACLWNHLYHKIIHALIFRYNQHEYVSIINHIFPYIRT